MKHLLSLTLINLIIFSSFGANIIPSSKESKAGSVPLDVNIVTSRAQFNQALDQHGLNAEEKQEVNDYLDFAVKTKLPVEQVQAELESMLGNIAYTGASFDSKFYYTVGAILVGALLYYILNEEKDQSEEEGKIGLWECTASSNSVTRLGYGNNQQEAMNNALSNCSNNTYVGDRCYLSKCDIK